MANKYKTLLKNSTTLAAGAFFSKALVFLLMPLYSSVMSTAEYGIADLVAQTANLLFPLVTLGICQSVFRFSFGKKEDRKAAFSTGLLAMAAGLVLFFALIPLLKQITAISDYMLLLGLYVFMYGLHTLCGSLLRGLGMVRAFASKGIICTAATLMFNILFLLVFKMGVVGYLLANICADFVTVIYMVWGGDLLDYVDFRRVRKDLIRDMLKFSLPLIPTTVCWWIVNMSDRYLVTYMVSEAANGVYSMAYKIPNIMITLTGIFTEAWQMSLVNEENKGVKWGRFFTRIFDGFKSVMFIGAAGLILFIKPVSRLLARNDFYESWKYMPVLIMACLFTGIVSFISDIYVAKKKSVYSLIDAVSGAALNIVLNLIFINWWGAMGAAIATLLSYFAVYIISTYMSLRCVGYRVNFTFTCINFGLLLLQSVLTIAEVPGAFIYSVVLFLVITVINFRGMYASVTDLLAKRRGRTPTAEAKVSDSEPKG